VTTVPIDLARERATRRPTRLHFRSAVAALSYADAKVRELRTQTAGVLLADAVNLDNQLATVHAILAECLRLHAEREGISR
jgi:hypothetical protein